MASHRKELQHRAWSYCVQLIKTHTMLCMLTLRSRWCEVSQWPDLRSTLDLDLRRSSHAYFDAYQREDIGAAILFILFLGELCCYKNEFVLSCHRSKWIGTSTMSLSISTFNLYLSLFSNASDPNTLSQSEQIAFDQMAEPRIPHIMKHNSTQSGKKNGEECFSTYHGRYTSKRWKELLGPVCFPRSS